MNQLVDKIKSKDKVLQMKLGMGISGRSGMLPGNLYVLSCYNLRFDHDGRPTFRTMQIEIVGIYGCDLHEITRQKSYELMTLGMFA